ncbi:hypothetical protein QZH41_013657 [Actinostola sp. cb2023]|nr:hypothetical protein QZH41_013657 [Actinostola sp. cb2023]
MAAQEKTNSAKIAKVLVFAPPRICFHQPLKKAKIENKVFAQSPEDEVCVTLWGRQSEWLDSLRKAQGTVWELQYLTAKHDSTSGTMVLHTSPKSTKKKLNNDHELAKPLLSLLSDIPVDIKTFRTIKELLEAKFTGNVEVNGRIHSMTFRSVENEALEVESCHDIEALEGWCHRLTYIGCATCSRALIQDKNKIYGQCTYCVFHKPGYNYALVRYFRNVTIRVKDADGVIEIIANHKSACKLFNGIEAKHFDQSTNNQISPKVREFIETVRGLFSCDKLCGFILSCHTIRDENSFVMCRTFNLLDCVQQASIKKHAQTEK